MAARRDPYLWVHLAGLAAVPLFLELCLAGLATGRPVLPARAELAGVAITGIVPVVWMQWRRPFYIFSLVLLAIRPAELSLERRQLLPLFRSGLTKLLTLGGAVLAGFLLWQLYRLAPLAAESTPLAGQPHLVGLLVAALSFLGFNLFLQVPLSVLRVLLADEKQLADATPYEADAIATDFSIIGLRVNWILPEIADPVPASSPVPSQVPSQAPSKPEPIRPAQAMSASETFEQEAFEPEEPPAPPADSTDEPAPISATDTPIAMESEPIEPTSVTDPPVNESHEV
ncbi:low-complexity tail membrane protein [Romeria aff. gracilis LEGE 07310]|uniref:Low-complexity tail membrane protein n=1 Tax=Vasconcelosia minhoensis LEGE 07310 TaxID=915328 RepID=A0A8J7A9R2_9CYAN|nr:low-complexity tail membrane protein [Romeria gracilis]MBE9078820.1 low-complexity tail membrane protein [Romeria aff. gracilis LEGE 07310]